MSIFHLPPTILRQRFQHQQLSFALDPGPDRCRHATALGSVPAPTDISPVDAHLGALDGTFAPEMAKMGL